MTVSLEERGRRLKVLKAKVAYFWVLGTISYGFVGTFTILFFLDYLNFIEVGLLLALGMFIQALTDYPTGALGDYVGQKNVLVIAFTLHVISIIILLTATTFFQFLIYVVLSSLGLSQESGALMAWFDNSYKFCAVEEDPDRTKYGAFMGTMNISTRTLGAGMIILSGILAVTYDRRTLFLFQLGILIIYLISVFLLINRVPRELDAEKPNYWRILSRGLKFVTTSKGHLAFFLAITLAMGAIAGIWGNLILFPLYASYGKTDDMIAFLRFITWGFGILIGVLIIRPTKKIKNTKRALMWLYFPSIAGLFICVTAYYALLPPDPAFNLFKFIGLALSFNILSIFRNVEEILEGRFWIDFIPDETRNALYSLVSTFVMVFGIPASIVGGFIIESSGILSGMVVVTIIEILAGILGVVGLYWLKMEKSEEVTQKPAVV
jgi:MFS family permease